MKTLDFCIDTNANVQIDANGFHGEGCLEAAKSYMDSIGSDVSTTHKAELNESEVEVREGEFEG